MSEFEDLWDKRDNLFVKACQWEHLPMDKIVPFSDNNPYAAPYRKSEEDLLRLSIRLMERSDIYK